MSVAIEQDLFEAVALYAHFVVHKDRLAILISVFTVERTEIAGTVDFFQVLLVETV